MKIFCILIQQRKLSNYVTKGSPKYVLGSKIFLYFLEIFKALVPTEKNVKFTSKMDLHYYRITCNYMWIFNQ